MTVPRPVSSQPFPLYNIHGKPLPEKGVLQRFDAQDSFESAAMPYLCTIEGGNPVLIIGVAVAPNDSRLLVLADARVVRIDREVWVAFVSDQPMLCPYCGSTAIWPDETLKQAALTTHDISGTIEQQPAVRHVCGCGATFATPPAETPILQG